MSHPNNAMNRGDMTRRKEGFQCPNCGTMVRVIDSRSRSDYRIRRYRCRVCDTRLSTVEHIIPMPSADKHVTKYYLTQYYLAKATTLELLAALTRALKGSAAADDQQTKDDNED